jgi:hypothetical protein
VTAAIGIAGQSHLEFTIYYLYCPFWHNQLSAFSKQLSAFSFQPLALSREGTRVPQGNQKLIADS